MKKTFTISRAEANIVLIGLRKFARPDAFIIGKVIKFIEDHLAEFTTPVVQITIESLGTPHAEATVTKGETPK